MPLVSSRELKTQGMSLMVNAFTGSSPIIQRHDNYNEIILTDEQVQRGQQIFKDMLESKPGEVRLVGMDKVVNPVIIKKYIGWIIGIPAALVIIGGLLKR